MAAQSKWTQKAVKKMYTQHLATKFDNMVLKKEQMKVVCDSLNGFDCFAVLPTGFGKSLCFMLIPLMLCVVSIT